MLGEPVGGGHIGHIGRIGCIGRASGRRRPWEETYLAFFGRRSPWRKPTWLFLGALGRTTGFFGARGGLLWGEPTWLFGSPHRGFWGAEPATVWCLHLVPSYAYPADAMHSLLRAHTPTVPHTLPPHTLLPHSLHSPTRSTPTTSTPTASCQPPCRQKNSLRTTAHGSYRIQLLPHSYHKHSYRKHSYRKHSDRTHSYRKHSYHKHSYQRALLPQALLPQALLPARTHLQDAPATNPCSRSEAPCKLETTKMLPDRMKV